MRRLRNPIALAGLVLAAILTMLARPAAALDPPVPGRSAPTVSVGGSELGLALPLPDSVALAVASRDHATALEGLQAVDPKSLHGNQVGDLAFLVAWEALRAAPPPRTGRPLDPRLRAAVQQIDVVRQAAHVPAPYLQLTVGELLLADGKAVEAARTLAEVRDDTPVSVRARLKQAEALTRAGATRDATKIYRALVTRPDPAPGTPEALLALANKAGDGSPAAYPYLRRLWANYPLTAQGRVAERRLAAYEAKGARYQPTADEVATRLVALMNGHAFRDVETLYQAHASAFTKPSPTACRAWYARGRSSFKRNRLTLAAQVLEPAGTRCAELTPDLGAKALYLAGKSLERRKAWADAARVYERLPELYPSVSMADDGYLLGGIAWQIAGDRDHAMALWKKQVAAYPSGDMAAEAYWRLAWNSYLGRRTDQAIRWAEKLIWEIPISADPVRVTAALYWAARWRVFPDFDHPNRLNDDPEQRTLGIEELADLCMKHPTSFYALLAANRLYALAPDRMPRVERAADRPRIKGDDPDGSPPEAVVPSAGDPSWTVRTAFMAEPAVQRGLALARLGLAKDAMAELDALDPAELTASENALIAGIMERYDWVAGHERLHHFLLHHPPSTLHTDRLQVMRLAYPNAYWDEVQEAMAASADVGRDFDPRVFHALVREESSFNPNAVSWAGARGLCQLMPRTARSIARSMGRSVTSADLLDPATNLALGARYLRQLADRYDGNLFLAVAGYNAGEGNVNRWLADHGDRPTDEFIEQIPLRETRNYVKRVLGTYQVYRAMYGPDPLFPDWSATNAQAKP